MGLIMVLAYLFLLDQFFLTLKCSQSSECNPGVSAQSQEDLYYDAGDSDETSWREQASTHMSTLEESLRQLSIVANRSQSQEELLQRTQDNWNSSNNFLYIFIK